MIPTRLEKNGMEKKNNLYNYDFSQYTQLIAVYLFGSRVTGKERPDTDFDIALIVDDDFDFIRNYEFPLVVASKLEGIVGTKVDVVLFDKMDPLFQTEIRTKGKPIYVRSKEKLKRIFLKARKEFEDYLWLHKHYIKALEKRYTLHG